jgi:hypothetical protein
MTGQKDRYSTQEKLWKLDDEQLTTPRHDEMVIDLLTKGQFIFNKYKNPFEIRSYYEVLKYYKNGNEWKYENKFYNNRDIPCGNFILRDRYGDIIESILFEDDPALIQISKDNIAKSIPALKIKTEVPLSARNGFLVGYLDVLLETPETEDVIYKIKEVVISNLKYELLQTISINKNELAIEVKPYVESFGKTQRQLNTYREYFKGKIMLYTDDMRFKSVFESQDIQVISTPDTIGDL